MEIEPTILYLRSLLIVAHKGYTIKYKIAH